MAKFKSYNIKRELRLKLDINAVIGENHLCKRIEQIVSTLDTSSIEKNYSSIGQNALHPKMMLSIIFYGYARGIRSGRKLAIACEENLPYIYLSKGYYPKKTALNEFRRKNYLHFHDLFVQVIKLAEQEGLGDFSFSMGDGTKLGSNSAKRRTKNKEQFSKWQKALLDDIADIEKELLKEEKNSASTEEIEKNLASKKNLEQKISTTIEVLEEDDSKQSINLTDADAPIMKGKKGNFDTFYNAQIGCNENEIIGYCDVVTAGNDKARLIPTIKGIEKNTAQNIKTMLADADYGTLDSLEYMNKKNITGYVPYRGMNTVFDKKPFHSSHFKYRTEKDNYICPKNEVLEFIRERKDKKRNQIYKEYRTDACKSCPFQKQCCPKGVARRVISRELRQGLRDEMKKRLNSEEGKKVYKRRLHPIESIFGHLKFNLGYSYFLLRGIEMVKAEFVIMCLSYNLQKLANHSQLLSFWVYQAYMWLIYHFKAHTCKVVLYERSRKNLPMELYNT